MSEETFFNNKINYSFTGTSQKITLPPGIYQFECWGAQGITGSLTHQGGKGAYVKGVLKNKVTRNFYLFVGEYGKLGYAQHVFNGGGPGQFTGGGATDIRLKNGAWDDFESLKSRIIVAAGGGGPDTSENGGSGGTINGISSKHGEGGFQTKGGTGISEGKFGKGGGLSTTSTAGNGGGGGGYYGGGSSNVTNNYAGGGGSSFISGHPGCDAISKESTENPITHTGQPIHYSGLSFTRTKMIDGDSLMPSPTESTEEVGHKNNGFIIITPLTKLNECTCYRRITDSPPFFISQIIILCTRCE